LGVSFKIVVGLLIVILMASALPATASYAGSFNSCYGISGFGIGGFGSLGTWGWSLPLDGWGWSWPTISL
jgi:hypothetical protein